MKTITVILACMALAACSSSPTRQALLGPTPLEPPPVDLTGYQASKTYAKTDYSVSPPKDGSHASIVRYAHEAESAAMAQCEAWFYTVENQAALGNLNLQQFNTLNSAAVAAVGLAGVTDPVVAASLGLLGTTVNALADPQLRALIAPTTYAVKQRVLGLMTDYIQQLEPALPTMPYTIVQISIRRLEDMCRPAAIQAIVTESVNLTTTTVDRAGRLRTMAK